MEFYKHFFGESSIWFHLAGVIFCLIGAIVMKAHYYHKHKAQCKVHDHSLKFDLKKWIDENLFHVLTSVVLSFIGVRFLDVFLHWVNPKMEGAFGWALPLTEDQVFYYLAFGVLVQWFIHRYYKKKESSKQFAFTVNPDPDTPPPGDDKPE